MEHRLQLLDSFPARGNDGASYRVHGFEHQVRDDTGPPELSAWMATGQVEYRLDDGRRVDVARDGAMVVADSQVRLEPQPATAS
jgi:hypothetical protein